VILSNGRQREPLVLSLPLEYREVNIRKAELPWRADHYDLALTCSSCVVGRSSTMTALMTTSGISTLQP